MDCETIRYEPIGDVTRFLDEGAGEPIETRLGRATIELLHHRTLD